MGKGIRLAPPWRVAFVDDSLSTVEACSMLLSALEGFECVGKYLDGPQALEAIPESKPDIVVTDLRMPGMDGLEFARRLREIHPTVKIIVLTAFADAENVREAIQMGVAGFLTKPISADEFRDAFNSAAHGTVCLGPGICGFIAGPSSAETAVEPDYASLLTPREMVVLWLYAKGKPYKEIADELSISVSTVKNHLTNIRYKLGVTNSIEAVNRVFNHNTHPPLPPPPRRRNSNLSIIIQVCSARIKSLSDTDLLRLRCVASGNQLRGWTHDGYRFVSTYLEALFAFVSLPDAGGRPEWFAKETATMRSRYFFNCF